MRKLEIINKKGQVLSLLNNREWFVLSGAEGLHGIETEVNETETPYTDGTTVDSVKALPRGIELTLTLRGNIKASIDYVTSIVKSKQWVTLREVEGERDITVKGIVTIPPYSRMLQTCKIVISIYCPQPYWEDLHTLAIAISNIIDLLYFPAEGQYFTVTGRPFGVLDTSLTKTFTNDSDTAVGMVITLTALGEVINPLIICGSGEQVGWYIKLNITLQADDELEISTVRGDKYIKVNGLYEYNGEPILNYLDWGGEDWLQLETGENTFSVTTEDGATNSNLYFNITYKGRYE